MPKVSMGYAKKWKKRKTISMLKSMREKMHDKDHEEKKREKKKRNKIAHTFK